MDRNELKKRISNKLTDIMNEAIKIDHIAAIVTDMENTMARTDLTETTRDALAIGYTEMLKREHAKIKYIWLHLYDLRKDVEDEKEATDETV